MIWEQTFKGPAIVGAEGIAEVIANKRLTLFEQALYADTLTAAVA